MFDLISLDESYKNFLESCITFEKDRIKFDRQEIKRCKESIKRNEENIKQDLAINFPSWFFDSMNDSIRRDKDSIKKCETRLKERKIHLAKWQVKYDRQCWKMATANFNGKFKVIRGGICENA